VHSALILHKCFLFGNTFIHLQIALAAFVIFLLGDQWTYRSQMKKSAVELIKHK